MADLRSASVGALSVLGLTLLGAAVGCGRSNPASAMRPDAPTARAGLGESACSTTPLVVDLPSPQRVAVEAELSKGRMMLAHYECSADGGKLTLMRECTHFVGYKYAALTRREEIVRMNDADAVRAQLPLTGDGLAANLSGELSRGSTLDLALVNVGRYVAPSKATYVDEVPKGCERATHAISAISTGAFAMSIGTRAHARAVAEIFSAGASAESRSELVRATRDGSLDACDTSEAGKPPPEQCRAPLRMELRPIDPRTAARAKCEDDIDDGACFEWQSRAFDDKDKAQTRASGMLALERCRKGRARACNGARMYAIRAHDASIDLEEIERLSCEHGDDDSCATHGQNLIVAGKVDEGFTVLKSACFFKDRASACTVLGSYAEQEGFGPAPGPARDKLLANVYARGCRTSSRDCERYAELQRKGIRAEGDFSAMKKIVASCTEKQFGCSFATAAYALGLGVPRDFAKAKKAWALHCEQYKTTYLANQKSCEMPKAYLP